MKRQLDGMVDGWLSNIDITDDKVKDELVQGMNKIVNETKEESGVWQLMVCASAAHQRNVTQLQKVQEEYNTLKTRVEGGTFNSEEARIGSKRKDPEEPTRESSNAWDVFESSLRGGGVSNFTPEASALKELRQNWTQL